MEGVVSNFSREQSGVGEEHEARAIEGVTGAFKRTSGAPMSWGMLYPFGLKIIGFIYDTGMKDWPDSWRQSSTETALWDRWRMLVVATQRGPFVLKVMKAQRGELARISLSPSRAVCGST